jgi:hypothetical protein
MTGAIWNVVNGEFSLMALLGPREMSDANAVIDQMLSRTHIDARVSNPFLKT